MTTADLRAGQIDVAGVATAVIDTGAPPGPAAAPPVLLLHGSGPGVTAAANWRPVIPALSADRRVIAPDQLGFGGTATGEPRSYGRAAWTDHALALLDTLGLGTVDVIGNSMGGAIALSMAVARPGAVRRIVTMGSMGVAMALPYGLNEVWGYTPGPPQSGAARSGAAQTGAAQTGAAQTGAAQTGAAQMRHVIELFAHNRWLVTDDLMVNKSVAEKAMAVKADELIRKPFQPQDLIVRVKNLLNPKPAGATSLDALAGDGAPRPASQVLTGLFSAQPVARESVAAPLQCASASRLPPRRVRQRLPRPAPALKFKNCETKSCASNFSLRNCKPSSRLNVSIRLPSKLISSLFKNARSFRSAARSRECRVEKVK